ncbi:MAG: prenyltransferase [Hyphomicrobiales bacterium]|nr:MAG: prenyltransferase [Hyphomicrobiales bacterium]
MVRQQHSLAPAIKATVLPVADLWCTYAACRTLKWLGVDMDPSHKEKTINVLQQRQNGDGGFAWSRGMRSDTWATFYCSQGLTFLIPDTLNKEALAGWADTTKSADGGYAMVPGQSSDIWATHYAVRVITEICQKPIHEIKALLSWLAKCQAEDGGLTWSPEHAVFKRKSDVRACFYGVAAWRAVAQISPSDPPFDTKRLVQWIKNQQTSSGGFQLNCGASEPCLWASYRASATLSMLADRPLAPVDEYLCRTFGQNGPIRWQGYDIADIWAAFCWVGTAQANDFPITTEQKDQICRAIQKMALPSGGFTYREPNSAVDSLAVASAALIDSASGRENFTLVDWLNGCQMPNEGGIMYMPGRGAEVRCTHWALAAGAIQNNQKAQTDLRNWLSGLQNPDGGFGYWEGRASDLVSTAAAAETAYTILEQPEMLDAAAIRRFVSKCAKADGTYSVVPGAESTARSTLQALRILNLLGENVTDQVRMVIDRHQVPSGGIAEHGKRLPDLATTYEAVITSKRVGLNHIIKDLELFLARLTHDKAVAWNPMAPPTSELMPVALATLLKSGCPEAPALALT